VIDVRVAVIGGGFGGLLIAIALELAGVDDVVVVEASDQPGGCARTVRARGYALEPGAGSFSLPHPALGALFDQCGVCVEPARSRRRFIHDGDRLAEVTTSAQVLSRLSLPTRIRVLAEPWRRRPAGLDDESLSSFLHRRLGKKAGTMAAELMAAGVVAGDGDRLSVTATFPMLPQLEIQYGSLVRGMLARRRGRVAGLPRPQPHIPCGGMDVLADSMAKHLQGRFRPSFPVSAVGGVANGWRVEGPDDLTARHLVLALPAMAAATVLGGEAATLLRQASMAPVVVAAFSGKADDCPLPDGFGVLCPGVGPTLGILFESSYAPGRSPAGRSLVKVIAGGARSPEVSDWSDQVLARSLGEDIKRVLGWSEPQLEAMARRTIPQYPLGHRAWLARVESLTGDNLHLGGWSYRGPGLAQLAGDARRIASVITG